MSENDVSLNALGEKLPLLKPEPTDISAWSDLAELNNFSVISAFNQAEVSRKAIDLQRSGIGYTIKANLVVQRVINLNGG